MAPYNTFFRLYSPFLDSRIIIYKSMECATIISAIKGNVKSKWYVSLRVL